MFMKLCNYLPLFFSLIESSLFYPICTYIGTYTAPGTQPSMQYDNFCGMGYICNRGTQETYMNRTLCSVGYYCPPGK